jgi:hypothetical protein
MDDAIRVPRFQGPANPGSSGGGESEYGPFVASKLRPHFHRPDCEWALCISAHNVMEFASHSEAVQAGKKPCKTCRA